MKKFIIFSTALVLLGVQNLFAQLPNGEKTLLHTQTGKVYPKGKLGIYSNTNFYSKIGDFLGDIKPDNFESINYWLVQGNFVFTYGIMEHFDASVGVRLYQDTHAENEFNLPDDIFVTLKTGSFTFARNHFSQAVMASFRIPTGEVHNYPFTEYTTESVQYGLMYAISYFADPYLPDRSFNAHFNAGFWNYNEHGTFLYETFNGEKLNSTVNSSDFRMAMAFAYPTGLFDFRLELTGMVFLQQPNTYVYSAEEWAFLSPSIRYKPINWIALDFGVDFRISPDDRNNTSGIPDVSSQVDLPPNFPDWTVQLGLNIDLNLVGESATSDLSYEEKKAREKVEMFEAVVSEREKSESVQNEIENLKKVRKEAEKEIDELKKILDDDQ
ncbi:MAG: TMF family protein [Calditrichaeota bacterium]|nr:MAG: TMF family protein [Calditrichota bacterium]MBL1207587.1 TMF family protein [Calditrichota bacterium]NOG47420.1 TMF family protein [Calditrichota bacterium]